MNLFNQRQPKRFSYTPRHLKEQYHGKSFDFESARNQKARRKKKVPPMLVFLIVLGMVIAIWYVLSTYEI
ncbi:MAG TPA: hypothetical protein VNJ50_00620 [Gelidibacter sp.]|uniref:hypothetical protein n=1 Tax=Gelidibacter sp. TaxID=2018083 RepID=UPI002B735A5D|nr:hypothetical protein [Gelidibacter sp.]HXJ97322.1 hypothetical protein [Gelidibacter sp.]